MIVFENDGLLPIEMVTTLGVNVKVIDNPIGHFGTGLKYAIAVILRLGGRIRLFVGTTEYEFYLKSTNIRGKDFDLIRMKKRHTLPIVGRWQYDNLPFTTEFGKEWSAWMAVRELESNVRDEVNGSSFAATSNFNIPLSSDEYIHYYPAEEGKTRICVECPEFEEAYQNLDQIFMPEKKLIQEIGPLEIYEGQSDYVFYRGLRVTDLGKPSLFTYNFNLGITLTEDRTSKWPHSDIHRIMECIMTGNNEEIIKTVMDSKEDEFYEGSFPWDQSYVSPTATFEGHLSRRVLGGGRVPSRLQAHYDIMHKEDEVDPYLDVKLTKEQITFISDCIKLGDPGNALVEPTLEQLKRAFGDEEIPF